MATRNVASLGKEIDETKEQNEKLLTLVEQMNERFEKQEAEIAELREKNAKMPADDGKVFIRADRPETGGWVIKAPNDQYFEKTMGVQFTGGIAIVYLEHENSDFIVDRLENDFGYEVQAADDQDLIKVDKVMRGIKPKETDLVGKLVG